MNQPKDTQNEAKQVVRQDALSNGMSPTGNPYPHHLR